MKTKNIVKISISATLIIIASQIKIVIGVIPMTLQLLMITLLALQLSEKEITSSIIIYILTALVGLVPIASGISGPMIIMAPSFSFIIGFIAYSFIIAKYKSIKAITCAYIIFYIISLSLLYFNFNYINITEISIYNLIYLYFLPFVVTDLISITAAYLISKRIK